MHYSIFLHSILRQIVQKNYKQQKAIRSFQIHALVSKIRNKDKRNQLRGFISKPEIYNDDAKTIRLDCSAQDIGIIGALLKGPGGLLDKGDTELVSADLFHLSSFPALDWKTEIGYPGQDHGCDGNGEGFL